MQEERYGRGGSEGRKRGTMEIIHKGRSGRGMKERKKE